MPVPKLVVTAALMAIQIGLQMTQRIKGPRLDETKVSTADYGTPMPRFWGIRRFECPIVHAEDLREEKTTTKTKSGKYEGYSYYGTFAVLVADQEIDAVTRIWLDRRLVYDATSAGPISLASAAGFDIDQGMRIYLGTEDQDADPRYVSWCEDRYGADSAPAYRGVSYIFFEDLPLEDFGNRIPQVSIEAVSTKTPARPYETKTTTQTADSKFVFSPSGQWAAFWRVSGGRIEWWDTASRTRLGTSASPGAATGSIVNAALAADGTAYQVGVVLTGGSPRYLWITPPLGTPTAVLTDSPTILFECTRVMDVGGTRHVYTAYATSTGYLNSAVHTAHAQSARDFCLDSSGEVAKLFHPSGSSNQFTIECTAGTFTVTGAASARSGPTTAYITYVESADHFFVISDGYYYLIDASDGSTKASGAWAGSGEPQFVRSNTAKTTFWTVQGGYKEWSLEDGSLLQSFNKSDWVVTSDKSDSAAFDPINYAVWVRDASLSNVYIRYLNRIASDDVTLQTVVDSVCGWCGLTEKDTAALTQLVTGYSVTQGPGKDMIGPLLDIHDVDARPHDFTLQFVNRGAAPSGTLLTEDFVRDGARYTVRNRQDTDLSKKITVVFADVNAEHEANTAIFQRPLDAVDSQRESRIDLSTYAMNADEAQQLVDRFGRREWNSREEIHNALTMQNLALEPADVTTVSLDGEARNVRLTKMTIARSDRGEQLKCEFIRDEVSFAATNDATTGAEMEGRDDEAIVLPPPVRGFVVDAPLAEDTDSDINPLLYTGAGPYGGLSFMGAAIYRGDDGNYDELFETVSTAATWGGCQGTLADVPTPWLWDRGNSLNVSLQSGSLTSVTEADINADPSLNLILVGSVSGWEYLNFTTATLEANGTYTLSGFKRGRRGTEWMTGSHTSSEAWILVDGLGKEEMGLSDVESPVSFKAQSVGREIDAAGAIDFTYTGATLKPYAPARVKWVYDGTDLEGTIIRRTRVGGAWVGGSTIPLSENSEEYEVDVIVAAAVVRTIAVSGTNTFAYTAAMAATDGVTLPTPPTIEAYQLSDAVGRGFALAA